MLSGRLYHAQDSELAAARLRARRLVFRYNQSAPENESLRRELARELFGQMGEGCYLEPPLRCDYGSNIRLGDRVYANFNLVVLDCAAVTIGNDVLIGPNVGIYTAGHPVDPGLRRQGLEFALLAVAPSAMNVLKLARLDKVFPIHASLAECLKGV